nr:TnsD family Tn7-like transposition protein [Arenimonas malthae]
MIRAGWISTSGRLATAAVGKGLKSAITALSALPEWTADTPSEATCISRVRSVLSEPGQGHPLKLLIVASCLFESWSDFLDEAKREETATRRSELAEEKRFRAQDIRGDFLKAAQRAASVTELAKEFNIAVRTAQTWLADEGRSTPRRPSKILGAALLRLTQGLSAGADPSSLAEETGLSESSVRRVLGTTVGLKGKWLDAKGRALRQQNRARWLAALSVAAPGGPKLARDLDPSAYAWLYRNDREWLAKKNSHLRLPASGNRRALDWDARDRALCKACRLAANELATRNRGARVALVDLVRVVPDLRTKICKLDRLPLTRSAIQDAVRGDVQQLPLELVDARAR